MVHSSNTEVTATLSRSRAAHREAGISGKSGLVAIQFNLKIEGIGECSGFFKLFSKLLKPGIDSKVVIWAIKATCSWC